MGVRLLPSVPATPRLMWKQCTTTTPQDEETEDQETADIEKDAFMKPKLTKHQIEAVGLRDRIEPCLEICVVRLKTFDLFEQRLGYSIMSWVSQRFMFCRHSRFPISMRVDIKHL